MKIQFYSFPMQNDGIVAMEKTLAFLEEREKKGDRLAQEERDWMEYAANVIHQTYQVIISS